MDFGKFIKQQRLDAGLTMSEVATMTGSATDKTALSRIENNGRGITFKLAFFLSGIYGIDIKRLTKNYMGKEAKVHKLTAADKKIKRGRPAKKAK